MLKRKSVAYSIQGLALFALLVFVFIGARELWWLMLWMLTLATISLRRAWRERQARTAAARRRAERAAQGPSRP